MRHLSFLFLWALCLGAALCQENIRFDSAIRTLQVKVDGAWGVPPVVLRGGGHYVEISFDDLETDLRRYTYTVTHCDADWTESELLTQEYMSGFNGNRIERYEVAIGTEMKYYHHTLTLPNAENELLVSGNYLVRIFEEDGSEPLAQACFSVLEPRVGVDAEVTANTDIDAFGGHQQVSFAVSYGGYPVSDPVGEFRYVVTQNGRWDNHMEDIRPNLMQINKVIFSHHHSLIFEAGNEYRRFEALDERTPTMRVDRMAYDAPLYHAFVTTDEPRANYLFDADQNGRYVVRRGDDLEPDTSCDYFITHFSLVMPEMRGGGLYLFGELTNNRFEEENRMEYNHMEHRYELALPLKQGAYNYQYLFLPDGGQAGHADPCEGNFHQTENEYAIYVYHRPFGLRYDKLVGFRKIVFKE